MTQNHVTEPLILLSSLSALNASLNLFLSIKQLDALNFIISLFQASTCFEYMCSSSGGQKLYYTTSGIITPIGGRPHDEHMCSKHVESWNKLIIKFSASNSLILRNKYIEMHGQQNIKICDASLKLYSYLRH